MHQSSEFCFFLNISKFRDAATGVTGPLPSPALLSAVYLWGVHLSKTEDFGRYEAAFLSLSLRNTADGLSGGHPDKVLHGIQAELLLAQYFLRNARIPEAKYHTTAAASLALSFGLGKIRTTDQSIDHGQFGSRDILPSPSDAMEEGERIRAFWAVMTLNSVLSAADGSPSSISYIAPGTRIDTPWPLDSEHYSEVASHLSAHSSPHVLSQDTLPSHLRSSGTIVKFLSNIPDNARSVPALQAKAGILFDQATRLASQYRPGPPFLHL